MMPKIKFTVDIIMPCRHIPNICIDTYIILAIMIIMFINDTKEEETNNVISC